MNKNTLHAAETSAFDPFERDRTIFEPLLPELLQTHRGQVIAIYQGQVVAVGSEIGETAMTVYKQFGYVPCYAQRVEERLRVYKMPSRRLAR